MAGGDVRYELKAVKAMRGTEGRSIAKWQKQGWELVSQDAATLHTTLNFRKVKRPLPIRQLVIGGAALAVVLTILGAGAALNGGGDSDDVAASRSTPTTSASPTQEVTVKPTPEVTVAAPTPAPSPPAEPTEPADGPITDITVDGLLDSLNAPSTS